MDIANVLSPGMNPQPGMGMQGQPQPQQQQSPNPRAQLNQQFGGLARMAQMVRENPQEAEQRFMSLARMGMDPPQWRTAEDFYNQMTEMNNLFRGVQPAPGMRQPPMDYGMGQGSPNAPMLMPPNMANVLTGGGG